MEVTLHVVTVLAGGDFAATLDADAARSSYHLTRHVPVLRCRTADVRRLKANLQIVNKNKNMNFRKVEEIC